MMDGLGNLLKKLPPLPQRVQMALSFLLFALTALIIPGSIHSKILGDAPSP
jgi:hypothetical protein